MFICVLRIRPYFTISFLFACFFLLASSAFSQSPSGKIKRYIAAKEYDSIYHYIYPNQDSAVAIAEAFLIPSSNQSLKALGLLAKGRALYNKDKLSDARDVLVILDAYLRKYKSSIEHNLFSGIATSATIKLFYIEEKLGNFTKAIEYVNNADNSIDRQKSLFLLYAVNYLDLGEDAKAIALFKQALKPGSKCSWRLPDIYTNIGLGYQKLYITSHNAVCLDSAMANYQKAFEIAKKDTAQLVFSTFLLLSRKAKIASLRKDYKTALAYYLQCADMLSVQQTKSGFQQIQIELAETYFQLGQYNNSLASLDSFYKSFAAQPSAYKTTLISAYNLSALNYEKKNNSKAAYSYAKRCLEETSKMNTMKHAAGEMLQSKSLKEIITESEKIIAHKEKKSTLFMFAGALLFLSLALTFLIYRRGRKAMYKKYLELMQRINTDPISGHSFSTETDPLPSSAVGELQPEEIPEQESMKYAYAASDQFMLTSVRENTVPALTAVDEPVSQDDSKIYSPEEESEVTDVNNNEPEELIISERTGIQILPAAYIEKITTGLDKLEKKQLFLKPDFKLAFVARKLNTNTAYLSQYFNQHKKLSFSDYAQELRIQYVLKELRDNLQFRQYTLQAIAEEIGYADARTFVRIFKKQTGLTPNYYLEELNREK
jgi:AraC-like DNA-binding protein